MQAVVAVVARQVAQRGHARVAVDVDGVAHAEDLLAALLVAAHERARRFQDLFVRGVVRQFAGAFVKHLGGVLHGAEEHAARAEQAGRHRALQGFRRADIGEAGRQRAGRDAMVGRGHQQGIDHDLLARRGQARQRGVEDHVDKVELADDLGGKVQATHHDGVGGGVADFSLYHVEGSVPWYERTASSAATPWPCGRTARGLISSSSMLPACFATKPESFTSVSTSASMSKAGWPR
ncbi:hypothetical protein D9M72_517190 [compost metagenome]